MLKNRKGFSLIEVLITCVVVVIVSVLSIRILSYQTEKTIATDGVMLLRKIVDAEIAYRLENRKWCLSFAELPVKIDGVPLSGSNITPDSDANFAITFKDGIRATNFVYTLKCKYRDNDNTELDVRATRCVEGEDFSFNNSSYRKGGYAFSYNIDFNTLKVRFSAGSMSSSTIHFDNAFVVKYLRNKFGG